MKIINRLILFLSVAFARPVNFANEEAANENPIPMVGEQFDYRAMVLNLLGLPTDAVADMVNERYKKAMGCDMGNEAEPEGYKAMAELAHAANVELKRRLTDAEAKIAANAVPVEVKIKIGDREVNAANESEVTSAVATITERATTAEATAANSRQSLRRFVLRTLVKEGRLTKAESDSEDARLAGAEFANAEKFEGAVAELAKRTSAYGSGTSAIFSMLSELGEAANSKAATATASSEFMNMVNEEMTKTGCDYEKAWATVGRTTKGAGLLASMKQPVKAS